MLKPRRSGYTRWTPAEMLAVAAQLAPLLQRGVPRRQALGAAQIAALPENRWQNEQSLRNMSYPSTMKPMDSYVAKFNAMPAAQRAALQGQRLVNERPEPLAGGEPISRRGNNFDRWAIKPITAAQRRYGGAGLLRWTQREKALLARMVQHYRQFGVRASLYLMFAAAQELVIPVDRRRSMTSLRRDAVGRRTGDKARLQTILDEGLAALWTVKDIPFDPPYPPGQKPPADPAAPAQAAETPIPAPIPSPTPLSPPEPPLQAPTGSSLADATRAFGQTMMGALDTLLQRHAALMQQQIAQQLGTQMAGIGTQVAALVEHGMREAVRQMIERELGGPVAPLQAQQPDDHPQPQLHDDDGTAAARWRLKVDVIGLDDGSVCQRVRQAFNGDTDIRFIAPDDKRFQPVRGRYVVLVYSRVPHRLTHTIQAAGLEPIYTKPAAAQVIATIGKLREQQQPASGSSDETAAAH
jgi:hypothetical protein